MLLRRGYAAALDVAQMLRSDGGTHVLVNVKREHLDEHFPVTRRVFVGESRYAYSVFLRCPLRANRIIRIPTAFLKIVII